MNGMARINPYILMPVGNLLVMCESSIAHRGCFLGKDLDPAFWRLSPYENGLKAAVYMLGVGREGGKQSGSRMPTVLSC